MRAQELLDQVEQFVADLLDPAKGYVVVKGYFTYAEIDAYRNECEAFLRIGPVRHTRINTDSVRDYVHPRSHDEVERTVRIYQYLHNPHSASTTAFLEKAFALRNRLEQTWMGDPIYRAEKLRNQDYMIVTKYLPNTGCLPRHPDYTGPAPFPMLQSVLLLSSCPEDYTGGDFTLHTRSGATLRIAADLGVQKGDLFLFDKSLDHSVDVTRPGTKTDRGRWSVLVGARAPRESAMRAFVKHALYSEPQYPCSERIAKVLRAMKIPV